MKDVKKYLKMVLVGLFLVFVGVTSVFADLAFPSRYEPPVDTWTGEDTLLVVIGGILVLVVVFSIVALVFVKKADEKESNTKKSSK